MSQYSETLQNKLNEKFAAEIEEARKVGNKYNPDLYGRFPWDRSERRGKPTTLTKASIGEFCFAILSCGGQINEIWPFNPSYKRSAVYYRVHLTMAQKDKIETETPFRFDPPPTVHV